MRARCARKFLISALIKCARYEAAICARALVRVCRRLKMPRRGGGGDGDGDDDGDDDDDVRVLRRARFLNVNNLVAVCSMEASATRRELESFARFADSQPRSSSARVPFAPRAIRATINDNCASPHCERSSAQKMRRAKRREGDAAVRRPSATRSARSRVATRAAADVAAATATATFLCARAIKAARHKARGLCRSFVTARIAQASDFLSSGAGEQGIFERVAAAVDVCVRARADQLLSSNPPAHK